ncbi:MAG: hypothetical protein HXY51_04360 [Nitrospirae bacterium]|nr:hypothetical protein [Nitrospirota bacterium]
MQRERLPDKVAFDIGECAQATKDVSVTGTGIDDGARRLVSQLSGERQGLTHAAWWIEHVWMGDDSEKAAQYQIGQAVGIVGVE